MPPGASKRHGSRPARRLAGRFCLMLLLVLASCAPHAREVSRLRITGGVASEQEAVRNAAQATIEFFAPLHFDLPDPLEVMLTSRIAPQEDVNIIGWYDAKRHLVVMRDYTTAINAARDLPPAFGLPMSPALWQSYLVHELAHAIIAAHYTAKEPALAPTEYIAAVAQITSLPEETRNELLSHYPDLAPFASEDEITELHYLMQPNVFAVKAYLHYQTDEGGPAFIDRILQHGLPDPWATLLF